MIEQPFNVFTNPNTERVIVAELEPYSYGLAAREKIYIASESVISSPTDTPANQYYAGVIAGDLFFRREMFTGERIGGRTTPDRGNLEVINTGDFDAWLDDTAYAWQAAPCKIHIYEKAAGFSSKVSVFDGVLEEPEISENIITFSLRNKLQLLDKLLQDNKYNDDYGESLNEKPKPIALGWIYNAPATLLENRIYQISDGEIESVTVVRDRGAALTLDTTEGTGGDVADYAALVAATPASGKYCTCLALGMVKVGLEPDGDLTVDGKGSTLGGAWSALAGDVYRWIVEDKLEAGTVSEAAITAMNATGYEVSYYIGLEPVNALDVLDAVLGNCGIWYGANREGVFDGGVFGLPAETASLSLGETEIERDSIEVGRIAQVVWKVSLKYKNNALIQSKDSLATAIGEAAIKQYGAEWQTVTAEDTAIKTPYPEALEKPFESFIYDKDQAQDECDKLLEYWKAPRRRLSLRSSLKPMTAQIGDTILVEHSRFNLGFGKMFVIIATAEYYLEGRTEITVAG